MQILASITNPAIGPLSLLQFLCAKSATAVVVGYGDAILFQNR